MEDIAFVDMELLQGMRLISQQLVVVMAWTIGLSLIYAQVEHQQIE